MTECDYCGKDLTHDIKQAIAADDIDMATEVYHGGNGHVQKETFCSLPCAKATHGSPGPGVPTEYAGQE